MVRSRTRAGALAVVAVATGLLGTVAPAEAGPAGWGQVTVTVLPTLGGPEAHASDINEAGQVAGYSLTAGSLVHATRWDGEAVVDLTPGAADPGAFTQATALNRRGTVTGRTVVGFFPPVSKALLWQGGNQTMLPPGESVPPSVTVPGAVNARDEVMYLAFDSHVLDNGVTKLWRDGQVIDAPDTAEGPFLGSDLNDRGVAAGTASLAPGNAYTWRPGEAPVALPSPAGVTGVRVWGLNDRGDVVGQGTLATGEQRAFRWRNRRPVDLGTLGGASTTVAPVPANSTAVNAWGDVVGTSETATGAFHAFIWRNGRMTDLGTLGGATSQAKAVNDLGMVIGAAETDAGETHAFVWQNGRMLDLTTLPGLEGTVVPVDINNRGQVAVDVYGPEGPRAAVVNVPALWGFLPE